MKKIGLVFLSLILTVVLLVACTLSLSTEDRIVGEYKSDFGTWEFDKDGDVFFSGLKGEWAIDDKSYDDESTDDESTDDESSESDSPQKISIWFYDYKEDRGLYSVKFTGKIERNGEKPSEKLSKLNLNLKEARFEGYTSMEEKFEGIDVIRLTRKQ